MKQDLKVIEDKIKAQVSPKPYTEAQKKGLRLENEYQWALTPLECSKRAIELQKKGTCNFFMHSDDHPVQGCSCCDLYEPVADKTHQFSIF